MGKGMLRAALVVLALLGVSGPAHAGVIQTLLKSDSLNAFCQDSSAVIKTDGYARMWIDIIATPWLGTADSTIILAVSARRHLSKRMITANAANEAAAYSDSTVVEGLWRAAAATTLPADTASVNNIAPTSASIGSNEIRVILRPALIIRGNTVLQRWTATVDLNNLTNGMPFRATWSSFKWRYLYPNPAALGPHVVNLRVILNGETW